MIKIAARAARAARTPITIPAIAPWEMSLSAFGGLLDIGTEVGVTSVVEKTVFPSCVCVTTDVNGVGGSVVVLAGWDVVEELDVKELEVEAELGGGEY